MNEILKSRFGFDAFRPRQEEICRSVAEGRDTLVVMPTGAGKSLCYQLPGLVRGGTTLVISPLVALIEDQVHRLNTQGIQAGRIHSGRAREESRETFRAYLRGELEFLFIAPERLAVPGFSEMLRKHPPRLIAVDEAHCISQWGHDFRPDYRLVGERLQNLEGTPIVALTATATETVQKDIVNQLRLRDPNLFIHGFRRENLAIQVRESMPSERVALIAETLSQPERLPAIVYAPTRKKAEELASGLSGALRCKAYHAGMPANEREAVQLAFLEDRLDVIVATVAFGMGIDKPNVRTVAHAALPASVEGYYQEIGRAGRDGLPSVAYLFHSYSDRKTHEFFLDRDFPDSGLMEKLWSTLPQSGSVSKEGLHFKHASVEPETFEKALEKLWIHGGARIDAMEEIQRVGDSVKTWKVPYEAQRRARVAQLDAMQAFTQGSKCRMLQLIQHFGDKTDALGPCGTCDRCAPPALRPLDEVEKRVVTTILVSIEGKDGLSAGRLFEEAQRVDRSIERSAFERLLTVLERERMLEVFQTEFEKDGRTISFRKIHLLSKGKRAKAADLEKLEIDGPTSSAGMKSRKGRSKRTSSRNTSRAGSSLVTFVPGAIPDEHTRLFESLRAWRLEEARKKGVPAFRILSDRVLAGLCEERPREEGDLYRVSGLGPKLVEKYGEALLRIVEGGH